MDLESMYKFIKQCLLEWHYPKIHAMDDTQIAELFSVSNRQYLIFWVLKKLYQDQFYTDNYTDELLLSFMYETGLCSKLEREKIFSPKFYPEQVIVLHRIFKFLTDTQVDSVVTAGKIESSDIKEISTVDLNLFPCYGPLNKLTEEESRINRSNQTKDKIIELVPLSINNDSSRLTCDTISTACVENMIKDIERLLPEMTGLVRSLFYEQSIGNNLLTNPNLNETIDEARLLIKKISQYVTYVNKVTEFLNNKQYEIGEESFIPIEERESYKIIKALKENVKNLSSEINIMISY